MWPSFLNQLYMRIKIDPKQTRKYHTKCLLLLLLLFNCDILLHDLFLTYNCIQIDFICLAKPEQMSSYI